MTNDELKKKIVEILDNNIRWQPYYYISRGIVYEDDLKNIADALIAAGIGDVKTHRVFVSKDGKEVKQLYSGEEVEKIVKERKELKDELRSKVEYIHEQDEVIKEYKHRAEVAERALQIADELGELCGRKEEYVQQAEKELAEEAI